MNISSIVLPTKDFSTYEACNALEGTLAIVANSDVYIKLNNSPVCKESDWKLLFPLTSKTAISISDNYTNGIRTDKIQFDSRNGIDIVVDEDTSTIIASGSFFFGNHAPVLKPELDDSVNLYFNIEENSLYVWNPILNKWIGPFRAFDVRESNTASFDSKNGIVYMPKVLPVARITIREKIGLTAELTAKNSVSVFPNTALQYTWHLLNSNTEIDLYNAHQETNKITAKAPGKATFLLTVTDGKGLFSVDTITLNFSRTLHVLGDSDTNTSFLTLNDAYEWIRNNDLVNQKLYSIEVLDTTVEYLDTISPTETPVIFRNSAVVNSNFIFSPGEYIFRGELNKHLIGTFVLKPLAKVTFEDLTILNDSAAPTIKNEYGELVLKNVILNTKGKAIRSDYGKVTLVSTNITAIKDTLLEFYNSDLTIKNFTGIITEGKAVAIISNSYGEISDSHFYNFAEDGVYGLKIENPLNTSLLVNNVQVKLSSRHEFATALHLITGRLQITHSTFFAENAIGVVIVNAEQLKMYFNTVIAKISLLHNSTSEAIISPTPFGNLLSESIHYNSFVGALKAIISEKNNYEL